MSSGIKQRDGMTEAFSDERWPVELLTTSGANSLREWRAAIGTQYTQALSRFLDAGQDVPEHRTVRVVVIVTAGA